MFAHDSVVNMFVNTGILLVQLCHQCVLETTVISNVVKKNHNYRNFTTAAVPLVFAAGSVVKTFVNTGIVLVQLCHQCLLLGMS